jgi:hypothetical protein
MTSRSRTHHVCHTLLCHKTSMQFCHGTVSEEVCQARMKCALPLACAAGSPTVANWRLQLRRRKIWQQVTSAIAIVVHFQQSSSTAGRVPRRAHGRTLPLPLKCCKRPRYCDIGNVQKVWGIKMAANIEHSHSPGARILAMCQNGEQSWCCSFAWCCEFTPLPSQDRHCELRFTCGQNT